MLILTRSDVTALFPIETALECAAEAFRRLSAGDAAMPQRLSTPVTAGPGTHLSMPCAVAGDPGILAVKAATVFPENPARLGLPAVQAALLLHCAASGRVLALLEAEQLTAARTGAAGALAADLLARPDVETVALFGAGALAAALLAATCAVRPVRRVLVACPRREAGEAFCRGVEARHGIAARWEADPGRAAAAADLVCTATTSPRPVFPGRVLRPGTHVNAMGAYTPDTRELDADVVRRARLFVDGLEAARSGAGDLVIPAARGEIAWDGVRELGDLLLGRAPGRQSDEEITLFKSVGVAIQDAVAAAAVYRAARERGLGTEVDLER